MLALAHTGSHATAQSTSGSGDLRVDLVAGKSTVTDAQARSPLKLLVPRPRGRSVWAYASTFGGGLLPGDRITFSATVAEEARCFLGTQSSTRIFRGGAKGAVVNEFNASVKAGGFLAQIPDAAQAFAGAEYRQVQRVFLADESSGLVLLDWYSSGRSARGERWVFNEFSSRTEVRVGERLAFLDSVHLSGEDEVIDLPSRMGRANCVATLIMFGKELEEARLRLLQEIADLKIQKRADTLAIGSAVRGGAVFRFTGVSVEAVAREIFPRLSFVSEMLGDNPFERKW